MFPCVSDTMERAVRWTSECYILLMHVAVWTSADLSPSSTFDFDVPGQYWVITSNQIIQEKLYYASQIHLFSELLVNVWNNRHVPAGVDFKSLSSFKHTVKLVNLSKFLKCFKDFHVFYNRTKYLTLLHFAL